MAERLNVASVKESRLQRAGDTQTRVPEVIAMAVGREREREREP